MPRPESADQFEEIFEEHHSQEGKDERKIIANRKKREEDNKQDLGI